MPQSKEIKDKEEATESEMVVLTSDHLPDVNRFTPKHFDFLESYLQQMYKYQYRHVQEVDKRDLTVWMIALICLEFFDCKYVDNLNFRYAFWETSSYVLLATLFCGLQFVFSRCFTRLYHVKIITLKVCQFLVIVKVVEWSIPFLLRLNDFISGAESAIYLCRILFYIVLLYYYFQPFIPFKHLKRASMAYFTISMLLFFSLLSEESFYHYIFKDNEIMVYSNFGARKKQPIEVIDSTIDEIIDELEE